MGEVGANFHDELRKVRSEQEVITSQNKSSK